MASLPAALPAALGGDATGDASAPPIRDFLLDADGDIAVVDGDFAPVAGADAVPQGIACRLRLFRGEYWLDEEKGVPYFDEILVKNPNGAVVRERLREAIADTPDVEEVIGAELDVNAATREAAIGYRVRSAYSTQALTESVEVET